jgi:hypothetical protein
MGIVKAGQYGQTVGQGFDIVFVFGSFHIN